MCQRRDSWCRRQMASTVSVIVAAHNEERVIERCLRAITEGAGPGELDLVVVCNGCSDETAKLARDCVPGARVIEVPVASKTLTWNVGDKAASHFPRFYVDADAVIRIDSIRRVAAHLSLGGALAASPRLKVEASHSSWFVRAFYDIWTRLPYVVEGPIGAGAFALSEQGRSRFKEFPPIVADDEFVRRQFTPEERSCVGDATFTIYAPDRLGSLLRIKTRSRAGGMELARRYGAALREDGKRYGSFLAELARTPRLWVPSVVYACVYVATSLRARWRHGRGTATFWDRDESSRSIGSAASAKR